MLLTIKLLCYVRPVSKQQSMSESRKKRNTTEQIEAINLAVFELTPD